MAETEQWFIRLRSRKDGAWLTHPELRERLVADALDKESSLNEIVLQILGRHYHVIIPPSVRRTAPATEGEELNLRMPVPLGLAIRLAAAANGRKHHHPEVLATLCSYYGLRAPAAPSRPRRPRRKSASPVS